MRSISALSSVVGLMALAASPAYAIDIFPSDYTVLPAGTNAVLVYGQVAKSDTFDLDGLGEIPSSELGSVAGIARYLHFNQLGGVPVGVQAFLPFGAITDAKVGGTNFNKNDGIGDLTVGVTAWPIHSAEPTGTTIGLTAYLTLPTGAYKFGPAEANLGSGTWTVTPQIGIIQGLGNGFFFDGALDVAFRADHDEQGLEVSRKASTQAQAYLRYQFSAATNIAIGYSGTFGGKDYVNDTYTGTRTRVDQLRLTGSTFLSPTLQLSGMIGTDVNVEGGFKQDVVGTIRLLKLF